MAIELTPAGGKTAVGVVVLKGDTQVDNENKMVLTTNIKIVHTHFPSLDPAMATQMDQLLRSFLPPFVTITLHQLVASVPKRESVPDVQLKNDPPVIFVSYKPAILLDVDGQPVRAPIQKTSLEYVVNTHWPLFFDRQSSMFYLPVDQQWLTAAALEGPWSAANKLPTDMNEIVNEPHWADLKKVIPPPANPNPVVPPVFYSASPSEIILFDGQPSYAQIPGTQLQYAANTESYLFFYPPLNAYYYLTAGRWFSANSLGGPWTFATPNLPADFARNTYGAASYHNSVTGAYGVSQTAYGPYGSATRTASYNPYTGTYARTASASTAYGSAAAGQAYNPYTGAYGAIKQGSNAYSQWGSSVVSKGGESAYTQHYSTAEGTVGSVQTSSGGKAVGTSTAYGTTAAGKTASGNMYAGHDGNVYKNTGSGWEKYDNGSWNSVQKPTTSQEASAQQRAQGAEQQRAPSSEHSGWNQQMERMQQEAQNRERGEQSSERFQDFHRSGGGERSWGGAGHSWGGGGFGRGGRR